MHDSWPTFVLLFFVSLAGYIWLSFKQIFVTTSICGSEIMKRSEMLMGTEW